MKPSLFLGLMIIATCCNTISIAMNYLDIHQLKRTVEQMQDM